MSKSTMPVPHRNSKTRSKLVKNKNARSYSSSTPLLCSTSKLECILEREQVSRAKKKRTILQFKWQKPQASTYQACGLTATIATNPTLKDLSRLLENSSCTLYQNQK